jgi:hypothetical protein
MNAEHPRKPVRNTRKERLAEALRANLKRRKQQSRGRAEAEKSPQNAVPAARGQKE